VTESVAAQKRPLLLLTTATADKVPVSSGQNAVALTEPLLSIYAERTFRFCFSNRQMTDAVVRFIWSRKELRPEGSPVYSGRWEDDAYSNGLSLGFSEALQPFLARTAYQAVASDWGLAGGFAGLRSMPLSVISLKINACREWELRSINPIPWSVG